MSHSPKPKAQSRFAPRTLSIGGATFDLFIKTDPNSVHECDTFRGFGFELGGKIGIREVIGTCGGGANNTAVGLSRLGCQAAFSGILGEDEWGQAIEQNMKKEGVDTRYLTVIDHEPSSFSLILMSESGERTILTHKSMDRHLHDVTFDREAAGSVDCVYLNHIHDDTCVIENDIVDILIKIPQTHLTWNPGGNQIKAGMKNANTAQLLKNTDLLLLNKEEAELFTGTSGIKEALEALIASGVKIACITDGANGATASDGTAVHFCPSMPCKVVDTTGAGDAFGTAMTWALLTGKDLPTALKAGTINAMSVVGEVGAQKGLLTESRIQTLLAR